MIHEFNRKGKAAGAGFMIIRLMPKAALVWSQPLEKDNDISEQEMIDRFLFVQALDTVRCLEEGVLESVVDANVGSIFGIGFAAWTGGAVQFLNQYGLAKAVTRAKVLENKYGERFKAPQLLKDRAAHAQPIQ